MLYDSASADSNQCTMLIKISNGKVEALHWVKCCLTCKSIVNRKGLRLKAQEEDLWFSRAQAKLHAQKKIVTTHHAVYDPTCASNQEMSTDAQGFPPQDVFLARARTPPAEIHKNTSKVTVVVHIPNQKNNSHAPPVLKPNTH